MPHKTSFRDVWDVKCLIFLYILNVILLFIHPERIKIRILVIWIGFRFYKLFGAHIEHSYRALSPCSVLWSPYIWYFIRVSLLYWTTYKWWKVDIWIFYCRHFYLYAKCVSNTRSYLNWSLENIQINWWWM